MTPSVDNQLSRARRGFRVRRWTTVLTTTGTGVVLVALAAPVGTGAAVTVGVFAAAAIAVAVWRAVRGERRWGGTRDLARAGAARASEQR